MKALLLERRTVRAVLPEADRIERSACSIAERIQERKKKARAATMQALKGKFLSIGWLLLML